MNLGRAQAILEFWFGREPLAPDNLPGRMALWFGAGATSEQIAAQDAEILQRFGPDSAAATNGELDHWCGSPHRMLALILLLDQVPRNAWRGSPQAFAADRKAQALTLDGLATGADAALPPAGRLFFYLPLEHAESSELQEESVAAYRRLLAEAPASSRGFFEGVLEFAERHRRVIQRFGRFPHRNAALGRKDTPEEAQYLAEGHTF